MSAKGQANKSSYQRLPLVVVTTVYSDDTSSPSPSSCQHCKASENAPGPKCNSSAHGDVLSVLVCARRMVMLGGQAS